MPRLLKSSPILVALIAGLAASGREARAQATYVGTFAMTNADSVKCLTVPNGSRNPTGLVRNPWAATTSQQWAFFLLPNGYYAIMNIESTLFVEGRPGIGLGSVGQVAWTGDLGQQWYLYPLGNQNYALVNVGTGLVLADQNLSTQNGTAVVGTAWTNSLTQWWHLYFLRN